MGQSKGEALLGLKTRELVNAAPSKFGNKRVDIRNPKEAGSLGEPAEIPGFFPFPLWVLTIFSVPFMEKRRSPNVRSRPSAQVVELAPARGLRPELGCG